MSYAFALKNDNFLKRFVINDIPFSLWNIKHWKNIDKKILFVYRYLAALCQLSFYRSITKSFRIFCFS